VSHPAPDASEVRDHALQACAAQRWDECLRGLDEARELDPTGDETPEVRAARDLAKRALDAQPRR
jgi:hypothetical protein